MRHPGLVIEASCRPEEAGPQPFARGENLKQFVSGMAEISCNLSCSHQSPGGVQVEF